MLAVYIILSRISIFPNIFTVSLAHHIPNIEWKSATNNGIKKLISIDANIDLLITLLLVPNLESKSYLFILSSASDNCIKDNIVEHAIKNTTPKYMPIYDKDILSSKEELI